LLDIRIRNIQTINKNKMPRKASHIVCKVNAKGRIIKKMGITDAGRYLVNNMPPEKRESWIRNGSYQALIKPFLNKNIRIDDQCVPSPSGSYWISCPPEPIMRRLNKFNILSCRSRELDKLQEQLLQQQHTNELLIKERDEAIQKVADIELNIQKQVNERLQNVYNLIGNLIASIK
jgi:hypothetical protein